MPKTIQQFIEEYDRLKKRLNDTDKEGDVICSQAQSLLNKYGLKNTVSELFHSGSTTTEKQKAVWNKLNPNARKNFSLGEIETFRDLKFDDLDIYIERDGNVDNWWRGLFNQHKTLYNARGNMNTFGINSHPQGRFQWGELERNTYMLGALYADNYIGNIGRPFLDVRHMSGDGIGNRAGTQFLGSYHILKSGVENAKILSDIACRPATIVYLNHPTEVKELLEKYEKNVDLFHNLKQKLKDLEEEKKLVEPEKLELIEQYRRISGSIDNLTLKVTNLEQNQKAQKNLTDSFFKGSAKGMSMRDELMSQSESLQHDVSNLSKNFNAQRFRNNAKFSNVDKKISDLGKSLKIFEISENKLKENSNLIKRDVSALNEQQVLLNTSVSGIQKQMDENSINYVLEKEKISGEIEKLKEQGDSFRPAINNLSSKLANLTKAHDLMKNSLLDKMKSLEQVNQTKFGEIESKNEDFKKRYDKDTKQLQRELGFVRAGIDEKDRAIDNLAGETEQVREAFGGFEKQANVKFKTLFDYNEYTNRQIRKQNTKKLTTLGNVKKAAQPDLLKKAFAGFVRGRFFDAQPILY